MKNETKYLVGSIILNIIFIINSLFGFFAMMHTALLASMVLLAIFGLIYLFFAKDKKTVIYGIVVNSYIPIMFIIAVLFSMSGKRV